MKRLLRSIVVFQLWNGIETYQYQFHKSSSSTKRNLELNCIPDEQDVILKENEHEVNQNGHRYDAYSQGDLSIQLIKSLRRKSKPYYESVLNNAIMLQCDVETQKERCVLSNSSLAAKDWNGTCVQAFDTNCSAGYCERISNCYWKSVVVNQNRSTRFPPEDYGRAEMALIGLEGNSYVKDLVKYSVIGIGIAVVSLFCWVIFFIGRYCCCCLWTSCSACYLCSPIPKEEGYRIFLQWILPSIFYVLVLAGIAFCGIVSFIGNEDVNVSASATFAYVSALIGDSGVFLSNSKVPLTAIGNIVDDAAIDALEVFDDTDYVRATANKIVESFNDFSDLHLSGIQEAGGEGGYETAFGAFDSKVTPTVDGIQDMLDTLENDLYDNVDVIQNSLDSVVSQIGSFEDQTFLWQKDVHYYESVEFDYRSYRLWGVLGIFLASTVIVLAGLIGIMTSRNYRCRKLHGFLDIAGFLSAVLASIAFVIASVSILISVVWYDACEMSEIVTSDFEPLLGEIMAKGANAIFNDTNLAEAFNVTDKIDFEEKLDEGLKVLDGVNITEQFETVTKPLEDIQGTVGTLSSMTLDIFNDLTNVSLPICNFTDIYSKDNILKPWLANKDKDKTDWKILDGGDNGDYARKGGENATAYIKRIYNVVGVCKKDSSSCCLDDACSRKKDDSCNKGDDCILPDKCVEISEAITGKAYNGYLEAFDTEQKMSADLGVECPSELSDSTPLSCPTSEFEDMGHNKTLLSLVKAYSSNITDTATDLVGIATTSVGDAMVQVQKFLCNMNVSFIATRYGQVRNEVCGTMLGGFAQINFSLWMLAIFLEIIAILASVLSTRLRGISKREAMNFEEGDSLRVSGLYSAATKEYLGEDNEESLRSYDDYEGEEESFRPSRRGSVSTRQGGPYDYSLRSSGRYSMNSTKRGNPHV